MKYAEVTITLTFRVPYDEDDTSIAHPWPRCECGKLWNPCIEGASDIKGAELIEPDVEYVEIDDCLCVQPGSDGDGGIECHCGDSDCALGRLGRGNT